MRFYNTMSNKIEEFETIENGKVNRMGVSRDNIDKVNSIISNKYGIKFNTGNRIYANEDSRTFYNIKF